MGTTQHPGSTCTQLLLGVFPSSRSESHTVYLTAPFRSKGHFGFRRYSNSVIIDVSFLHAKEMHLFLVHFFKGGRFQDFGFKEEYESKSQRLLEHEYIHVYLVHIGDYP